MFVQLFQLQVSSSQDVELEAVIHNFLCLLYPTNILNCSWSFHTLQKAAQLTVYIRYFLKHFFSISNAFLQRSFGRTYELFWACISLSLSVCSSSICDNERAVHALNYSSAERVGSRSLALREHEVSYVILQFNATLHDTWTLYTYTYNMAMLGNTPRQTLSLSCCLSECLQQVELQMLFNGIHR